MNRTLHFELDVTDTSSNPYPLSDQEVAALENAYSSAVRLLAHASET